MDSRALRVLEIMQRGILLFQEGDGVWYLAGVGYPRETIETTVGDHLDRENKITEAGDDESPCYSRGWKRWYVLAIDKAVHPHERGDGEAYVPAGLRCYRCHWSSELSHENMS